MPPECRPYRLKPAPIKHCTHCGNLLKRKRMNHRMEDMAAFLKRKYCNRECMAKGMMKEKPLPRSMLKRVQHLKKDKCQECGAEKLLCIHHLDNDRYNSNPKNLMTLCGPCHTKWHWNHGKNILSKRSVCKICGWPEHGRGYCLKHLQRFRKYGSPLLTKKKLSGSYSLVEETLGEQTRQTVI